MGNSHFNQILRKTTNWTHTWIRYHCILSIQTCTILHTCTSYCLFLEIIWRYSYIWRWGMCHSLRTNFSKKETEATSKVGKAGRKVESCDFKKSETATWSSRTQEAGRKWDWQPGLLEWMWKNGKGAEWQRQRSEDSHRKKTLVQKAHPTGSFLRPSLQFTSVVEFTYSAAPQKFCLSSLFPGSRPENLPADQQCMPQEEV